MKFAISGKNRALVPVPLIRTKEVPVPRQSGTGTNSENRVGTGTNPNGNGTTAPCNLDFLYFYIVKPKFIHRYYRNPSKWLTGVQIRMKLS